MPRRNGQHFADDIFKCVLLNKDIWISINISLKFVSSIHINNIPVLVKIMAWRPVVAKPLSEPMMENSLTHKCVTQPQKVKRVPLRWRHNGCDSVSNHQPHECLLRRLIMRTSRKTSKLRVTGLCAGNSPETGEFRAQMASNAENVSIWWRHHAYYG